MMCRPLADAIGPFRSVLFAFLVLCTCALAARPASAETLQGRVFDPDGRPVDAAGVLILRGQTVVSTATTAPDGTYGPVDLPAGRYDITVVAPGLRLAPTIVTIAAAPVALDLRLVLAAVEESLVVSAAQVDIAQSRSAASTSVVTRLDLDRVQARTVTDALRLAPGFNVAPSGTTGAQTSIFPRGGESDYTLVLVDGVPQNAFGGAFDAAHLATANVERVEIVRGPQSALYGSGAIGSIVHLITASGGRPELSATFEGGSYGTRAGTARASGSAGAFTFGGGLDWLQSDGDTRTFDSIGGEVSNDDYERASASASIGWSRGTSARVRFDVRGGRNERGFPGAYGSDPESLYGGLDTVSRGENRHASVGLGVVLTPASAVDHRLQLTWSNAHGDFTSPFGGSEDESRRWTGRYQADATVFGTGISGGAEIVGEEARNTFITDASFDQVPVTRNNLGLFAEARPAFGDRVFATVGVRVERIDRTRLEGDGSRPEFDSSVVWSANPKVALAWIVRDDSGSAFGRTKIRGGAGTGIKAPTAFDIAFTDNPDLRPERSRTIDVGVEQSVTAHATVEATWFYNSYDDLIVSISQPISGASRYMTDNIANARSAGLEIGATWRPSAALSARLSWTLLDTEILGVDTLPDVAPGVYTVGDRLLRRPRHSASLQVDWSSSRVSAFALIDGRGDMRDLEPNFAASVYTNPGRVNTTVGATVDVAPRLQAYGRIVNLFDRGYEDVFGFPAAGRSAIIGLRVAAGR